MNKKQRQDYSAVHIRRLKKFERQYVKAIYNALQAQIKDAAKKIRELGPVVAKREINTIVINTHLNHAIMDIYKTVGVSTATETMREIKRSAGRKGFGFDAEWINQIIEFFRWKLLNQAVLPISETTKQFILQVLSKGIEQGWGVDKIVSELENSDITIQRARMIVRTEAGKAVFNGEELAKEKTDYVVQDEWIAANDHRTRHSHHFVDGEVIDEGQKFRVPVYKGKIQIGFEYMKGPGDPSASPGNVINCRCKRSVTAKRDENGRLILK